MQLYLDLVILLMVIQYIRQERLEYAYTRLLFGQETGIHTVAGHLHHLLLSLVDTTLVLVLTTLQRLRLAELTMRLIRLRQFRAHYNMILVRFQYKLDINLDTCGNVFLIRGAKKFSSLFFT